MKTAIGDITSTRSSYRVTFVVLCLAVVAFALLQSLVTPVLPTIERELHATQTTVTWVLTAYLLSASIFTPILGRLGDMTGKKRMFVVALIALTVGSLLAAVATSLPIMIVARVIQGVGGGVLPLAFGIIRDEFPPHKVASAVGVIAALSAVGAGLGIVLAGPIVSLLSYRWLFLIPLIITALAAIATQILVPESRVTTPGKINWLTATLLSGWLVALLLAVSQAPSWGWRSAKVLVLVAVAVGIAVVWVIAESRSANPLIDMRMMRIRSVWTANLVALLLGVGMYASFGFLPQFLQTPAGYGYGFGASVTESGLMLLPLTIGMFVLGMYTSRLAERFGSKNVLAVGALIAAIGFFVVALMHSYKWDIYLATAIIGVGLGLAFSAMPNIVVAAVPAEQTGVASGMNANIRTIGGSLGAAVMASIVTVGASHSGVPQESGYTNGYLMLGSVCVLAAFAALLVPKLPGSETVLGRETSPEPRHGELAMTAGGTVVGGKAE
ncbi:MFS transporter [Rhodococcus globerulus]|uniref:MFS transporter n=1 Tax=Rhodococcus globerulus TaxID=33008 RepID=A0ABU4C3Y3_RHOGO|nr:MFS transporter [Rhodococcus globerulus]MDV6271129.1 MFS transporter [Rhodococcus globerulus]